MNTNIMYASRKRRKPVQKAAKPTAPDGVKSNPSKRHRDRLNTELDRLASLLPFPQEIISKLDKLSVLRLSVSYLRAKGFFEVALQGSKKDGNGIGDNRRTIKTGEDLQLLEGELLLQALNGFVLVVAADGLVFFSSSTIQDYLGFQQSDVIHQSVFELIHTEDRPEFQRQLHWALDPAQPSDTQRSPDGNEFAMITSCYKPEQLPPENSSFMERNFVCRLRCLLDNSSGFLAMNFQGRLKYLHGQNKKGKDGSIIPPQLALFALATPLQSPSILEIRTKNLIFRTKHKLDFTPIGCDTKGSLVLGYTEAELCVRGTGYQFIHAADMLYCAENHVRMIKTGESGMTIFRLLTKDHGWTWVQANARLVYKNGRPDYIIATQRPLAEEEGAEHLRKRSSQLPFIFATGEAVLYESSFPFQSVMVPSQSKPKGSSSKGTTAKASVSDQPVNPASLLGAMLRQDESVYICPPASNTFSFENFYKDNRNDLSNFWQNAQVPAANNNMRQEEGAFSELKSVSQSSEHTDVLPEVKNNELYNIMRSLGIDFDDLEVIQQDDEFFRNEFDYPDIGDIDVADEILTYVQESLNRKSDCMFMSAAPQMACVQDPSKVPPDSLDTTPMLQQPPNQMMPQQLCHKMKHMQVNGLFTNWNHVSGVPVTYKDQQPTEQYVPSLSNVAPEFYKSELSSAPYTCKQEYLPYQDPLPAVPLPSNLTQMDFDLGNVDQSMYSSSSQLDGFLDCLPQTPELQECSVNAPAVLMTSQPCYSGAVSMYQCLQEPQPSCLNQMQYNAVMPGQQQMINKQFQNGFAGGNVNTPYTAPMDVAGSSQTAPHLPSHHHHHLPANSKLYPDLPSSGFL
ncbi:aryl hydrocarbon receptor isoform X1 [Dendrobates tinctorius]|uniref:aryl hydrocarbon receptor isoform X1 n=1 Tax=Dendrobates tinctorius TaxID=92724 RepID=UPI003CCA6694